MSSKKKNELKNDTKDNPYNNYHGHQNSGGQKLENSTVTNKDSDNSTGKDSNKNKKNN